MALHHQTAKKYARNLINAIVAVAAHQIEHGQVSDRDEDNHKAGMSGTLLQYRPVYVPTVAYSGNSSLDNGDEVAALLRGLSPDETCAVADRLFGLPPMYHWERWQHLNKGQRRMNAGNRIRAVIRREERTLDDLLAALKGDDLTEEE
jgi:hypothetical protein